MKDNLEIPIMMSQCFWCGGTGNEVLISKRAVPKKPDRPKVVMVGYEPCDKCKSVFALGIRFIQVASEPVFDKQPEFQRDTYPTGKSVVLREEAVEIMFDEETVKRIKHDRIALLDQETFQHLFGDVGDKKFEENKTEEEKQ
jgi:hypothetical protein